MKLSRKRTTAWVVIATSSTARIEAECYGNMAVAMNRLRHMRELHPGAFVQVHKIEQALPEPPRQASPEPATIEKALKEREEGR